MWSDWIVIAYTRTMHSYHLQCISTDDEVSGLPRKPILKSWRKNLGFHSAPFQTTKRKHNLNFRTIFFVSWKRVQTLYMSLVLVKRFWKSRELVSCWTIATKDSCVLWRKKSVVQRGTVSYFALYLSYIAGNTPRHYTRLYCSCIFPVKITILLIFFTGICTKSTLDKH